MHAKQQRNEQLYLEKTISVIIIFLTAISDNYLLLSDHTNCCC